MCKRWWWLAAALAVAVLSWSCPGRAEERDPTAAEALFREGRAAANAGDHARACEKFRESNRLDPAPGTLLNIADCEEKQGRLALAWALFREVTERLPASDERHQLAQKRLAELEPRLPKLTIRLAPATPPGTRVERDGVELKRASLDSALPVDPGKHVIVVAAPGRAAAETTVTLREGEHRTEVVSAGPVQSDEVKPSPSTSGASSKRTLGYVLGGVGVVGIGVGAVTGVMVLGKKKTVDDNCSAAKQCNATGVEAAEDGRRLGTISGVSFIIGTAALAGGLVLVLTSRERERPATALRVDANGLSLIRSF